MQRFLWICLGGAAGTGLRYLVSGWVLRLAGGSFPYGTLSVNLLGSFLLGTLMHVGLSTEILSPTMRLAATAGLMGGFTTYSTFSYETLRLLQEGAWGLAALNVVVTVAACLFASFLGFLLSRWMVGG
jgi:fluoride exporter